MWVHGEPCTLGTCPECGITGWCPIEGRRPTGLLVECHECLALFITEA